MDSQRFVRGHFRAAQGKRSSLTLELSPVFTFELASTPAQLATGLMGRTSLLDNQGMLFVFAQPARPSFWMRDTHIPLDIAWLSAAGEVLEIGQLQPYDETLKSPRVKAKYAVELHLGTFRRHDIHVGNQLTLFPRVMT